MIFVVVLMFWNQNLGLHSLDDYARVLYDNQVSKFVLKFVIFKSQNPCYMLGCFIQEVKGEKEHIYILM